MVYVMCIATLPVLHRKMGEYEGQFRLFGGMSVPIVALVISLWLMTHASSKSWVATAVFMVFGAGLYLFTKREPASSEVD